MKARRTIVFAGLLMGITGLAVHAQKTNFSGTWVLDKNLSFSNAAGLEQTMTIAHTGDELKLDSKVKTAQGEREIHEEWTVDSQEREFAPPAAAPGAKGKRKAYWLPDNRRLIVAEETTTDSPKGPLTQQTTRKVAISADGAVLTIDYFIDRPGVSAEARRVFNKQ